MIMDTKIRLRGSGVELQSAAYVYNLVKESPYIFDKQQVMGSMVHDP